MPSTATSVQAELPTAPMTHTTDFSGIADLLLAHPLRGRLRVNITADLQRYFLNLAVATPAWPRSDLAREPVACGWLQPGQYTIAELKDRFAPRHLDNALVPSPEYQIIAARTIEAVSAQLHTLLLQPDQEMLVLEAQERGETFAELHQRVLGVIGAQVCRALVADIEEMGILLPFTAAALREAGRRRILEGIVRKQEQQQCVRSAHANKERYLQLLKRWQTKSGDVHEVHIEVESERAADLIDWLRTLSPAEAAIFLYHHHESARAVAELELAPAELSSIDNADLPIAPAPNTTIYAQLKSLLGAILQMPGYRRITVTMNDEMPRCMDIDQCHRVGTQEASLEQLIILLFKGLVSRAGLLVRAYPDEVLNVFVPEKGAFIPTHVRYMYGALLEDGSIFGFPAAAVEESASRTAQLAGEVREPSLHCADWPGLVVRPPSRPDEHRGTDGDEVA